MLTTVGNFGMGTAMRRYLPGLKGDALKGQYWMSIVFVFVGASLIITPFGFFAPEIAEAFFDGVENTVFVYLGIILMLSKVIQTHLILFFRLTLRFRKFSTILVVQSLFALSTYLIAALVGRDLLLLSITAVATDIVTTIAVFVIVVKNVGFPKPDFSRLRAYLSYGLPTMPWALFSWALNTLDRFMIAFFLGTAVLSVYAVAYGISLWTIMIVMTPIWSVLPATVTTLWNNDKKDEAVALLRKVFQYSLALMIMLACVTIFWGDIILLMYAGKGYEEGSKIIAFVVISYILHHTAGFYRLVFDWFEKTKIYMFTFAIAVSINLILNFWLIPKYEIYGAAVATLAGFGILVTIEIFISRKIFDIGLPLKQAFMSAGIGVLIAAGISSFPHEQLFQFIWQAALFCLLYILAVIKLNIVDLTDLRKMYRNLTDKGNRVNN